MLSNSWPPKTQRLNDWRGGVGGGVSGSVSVCGGGEGVGLWGERSGGGWAGWGNFHSGIKIENFDKDREESPSEYTRIT